MATKRDLVEAHAFSRRRLVTAFVSGAPGGREVEPARPARVIVGGAALAVLLIAGAAIAGIFTKKTPDDWAKVGLFVSKETAAAYVITDDEPPIVVRPVINITSAKLILGSEVEPTIIAQSALEEEVVGGDIGILGAPASPPDADRLIEDGWTVCTGPTTGLRLDVAEEPAVRSAVAAGSVVREGDAFYLIARARPSGSGTPGAYRYLLPRDPGARDNMLTALGLQAGAYATEVSETYLGLFPTGGDLAIDSFGLTDVGERAPYATSVLQPARGLPGRRRRDVRRRGPAPGSRPARRPRPLLARRLQQPPRARHPPRRRPSTAPSTSSVGRPRSVRPTGRASCSSPCSASSAPSSTSRRASLPACRWSPTRRATPPPRASPPTRPRCASMPAAAPTCSRATGPTVPRGRRS